MALALTCLLFFAGLTWAQPGPGSPPTVAPKLAPATAPALASAADSRPELKEALPQARLMGAGRLTVWGFKVYDARLWAPAGFDAARYTASPMALELNYLRDFDAADIAQRSLKEMRRSVNISEAQAATWTADMLRVIPDVKAGDRILGVHRPGVGASFWVNGKLKGEIRDAEFAERFFGIWMSPQTSEPQLREALIAGAGG